MGDQGILLIEKWESTGKLDYSNADETPATENGRRKLLSSGYKLQTYWDLLDEEFKPKGNKLLSIIELWTHSKQGDKTLNEWLTYIHNLVNVCKYPENSTDRIIRDVLITGCNSHSARDKIIWQGEAITLNQVIEILQTEDSANSTMRHFQETQNAQNSSTKNINYVSYERNKKSSHSTSNKQNSSSSTGSTGSKRQCFWCGEPYSKKHQEECRAKNAKCDGCGITGHFKKCCKKSGNFPKDNSNRQNQSSSTGPRGMNYAVTVPVDFFNEKGLPKEYTPPQVYQELGSMNILRKIQNNAILISSEGEEIQPIQQSNAPSISDSVPGSVPPPDFPFIEFPLTEVVNQSQIDFPSISDMLHLRETGISSNSSSYNPDFQGKSQQSAASHEEMRETRDLNISAKPPQSTRDSSTITISNNSTLRKSIPGTKDDNPTTFPVETDISFTTEGENPQNPQLSNNRSVMPTDVQALIVLQDLVSGDFQVKNTHSTQRKGEDEKNEAFQLIQEIHSQLQQVQWDLQRLHLLHKYKN